MATEDELELAFRRKLQARIESRMSLTEFQALPGWRRNQVVGEAIAALIEDKLKEWGEE